MGRVVVLGESVRVAGYALAGAVPVSADDPDAVRRAWAALDADVALVVITPVAARALGESGSRSMEPLVVEMPS